VQLPRRGLGRDAGGWRRWQWTQSAAPYCLRRVVSGLLPPVHCPLPGSPAPLQGSPWQSSAQAVRAWGGTTGRCAPAPSLPGCTRRLATQPRPSRRRWGWFVVLNGSVWRQMGCAHPNSCTHGCCSCALQLPQPRSLWWGFSLLCSTEHCWGRAAALLALLPPAARTKEFCAMFLLRTCLHAPARCQLPYLAGSCLSLSCAHGAWQSTFVYWAPFRLTCSGCPYPTYYHCPTHTAVLEARGALVWWNCCLNDRTWYCGFIHAGHTSIQVLCPWPAHTPN